MKRFALAAATTLALLPLRPAAAESVVPDAAAWTVRMNVAEAVDSPLGQLVLRRVRAEAPDFDGMLASLEDTIGLNPLDAPGTAVLYGDRFGRGEISLVAELTEGSGKLEGWMLALPGYQSEDLEGGQTLLHSFELGEGRGPRDRGDKQNEGRERRQPRAADARVFLTLPDVGGRTKLIASLNRNQALDIPRDLTSGDATLDGDALPSGRLMAAKLNRIPARAANSGAPGSAILQSLRTAELLVSSADSVGMELDLTTISPARARQLGQLLTGLQGLAGLAAMEQPELAWTVDMLQGVAVDSRPDDSRVTATLNVPTADVERALDTLIEMDRREKRPMRRRAE